MFQMENPFTNHSHVNTGCWHSWVVCRSDSCAPILKTIQDLRECAKTKRRCDCDGRGRHAPSTGQPFGTLAATAALPTPPPPRRPAPTTAATTRSHGDATAAPICCQPASHVTGGRQSDRVTISTPAPGCENHNIIRSSLSRCNSPSQPSPLQHPASKRNVVLFPDVSDLCGSLSIGSSRQLRVIIPSCLTFTQV